VRAYTFCLSGQKLWENVNKFSESHIEGGELRPSSASLMRIIVKWCEELQKNFGQETFMKR